MDRIRKTIGKSYVWVSVDETTDSMGRYVANLIVGVLDVAGWTTPFLVSVKMLEATNHSTVARFVNDGISMFSLKSIARLILLRQLGHFC